jgi:hypothetical protein
VVPPHHTSGPGTLSLILRRYKTAPGESAQHQYQAGSCSCPPLRLGRGPPHSPALVPALLLAHPLVSLPLCRVSGACCLIPPPLLPILASWSALLFFTSSHPHPVLLSSFLLSCILISLLLTLDYPPGLVHSHTHTHTHTLYTYPQSTCRDNPAVQVPRAPPDRTSTLSPATASIAKSFRPMSAATWAMMPWCGLVITRYVQLIRCPAQRLM